MNGTSPGQVESGSTRRFWLGLSGVEGRCTYTSSAAELNNVIA